MPTGCHHLTHCERCRTNTLLHGGESQREIARQLGRDPGTISWEMLRNRRQRGYCQKQAHGRATSRCREASGVPPQDDARTLEGGGRQAEGGARNGLRAGIGFRARSWRAVNGSVGIFVRTSVWGAPCTGACVAVSSSPTGAEAGMPDGATFPAGWTLPSALRWRRRSPGSGTGSWIRSSARGTGAPWSHRWIGGRSTRYWSGST